MKVNNKSAHPALFLDRDGTINIDFNFVHKRCEWQWCPGAVHAIKKANNAGYIVIVVTNQSGIIRGNYTLEQVEKLHQWVDLELERYSARVDAWYVAPWHPDFHDGYDPELLRDRKPDTGMFEKANAKFGIDYSRSFMAGDKRSDIEPALTLGITPGLIRSRHTEKWDWNWIEENQISVYDSLWEMLNDQLPGL